MWQMIETVLTSRNTWMVLLSLIALILIAFFIIRSGLITVRTKAISVGHITGSTKTRQLIQRQMEWTELYFNKLEETVPKVDGEDFDYWRSKFIFEKVYDLIVKWIIFNHIENDEDYIVLKQDEILGIVLAYTVQPRANNDEFLNWMKKETETIIKKLVQIRTVYADEIKAI